MASQIIEPASGRAASNPELGKSPRDPQGDSEGTMKNTVYVKDVESVIVVEPGDQEGAREQLEADLKEVRNPQGLFESAETARMKAADQINSQFITMMQQRAMAKTMDKGALQSNGIYQLFFANVQTMKSRERTQPRDNWSQRILNETVIAATGGVQSSRGGQLLPSVVRKLDPRVQTEPSLPTRRDNRPKMRSMNQDAKFMTQVPKSGIVKPLVTASQVIEASRVAPPQQQVPISVPVHNLNNSGSKSESRRTPTLPKASPQIIQTQAAETPSEDPIDFLFEYITLPKNNLYASRSNFLALKATSFFNDCILFEDEYLNIICKSERRVHRQVTEIELTLSFQSNRHGLILSSFLETVDSITCDPHVLSNIPLVGDVSQTFVLKFFTKPKIVDFPCLKLHLKTQKGNRDYKVLLPFSVNKYFDEIKDPDVINKVFGESKVFLRYTFPVNEETVDSPSKLKDWFDARMVAPNGSFLVCYQGAGDLKFVAEVGVKGQSIQLTLRSKSDDLLLLNYFKWFIWVFGKKPN